MPRNDFPPAYVDGDRILAHDGSIGFVRKTKNGWLRVLVIDGPRKGQWFWPEKFGKPDIHHSDDGIEKVCYACDRRFRTGLDRFGLLHDVCKTCLGAQRIEDQQRAASTDPVRVGDMRPRVQYRSATDDVEDLIAEETRGR